MRWREFIRLSMRNWLRIHDFYPFMMVAYRPCSSQWTQRARFLHSRRSAPIGGIDTLYCSYSILQSGMSPRAT